MKLANRFIDHMVVRLVRWRCERFNPRRQSTDEFLDRLGKMMTAEVVRRNRITGAWRHELDQRDEQAARGRLAAIAREQFETLAAGSAELQQ